MGIVKGLGSRVALTLAGGIFGCATRGLLTCCFLVVDFTLFFLFLVAIQNNNNWLVFEVPGLGLSINPWFTFELAGNWVWNHRRFPTGLTAAR